MAKAEKKDDKNPVVEAVEGAVEAVTSAAGSAADAVGSTVSSVLGRDEGKAKPRRRSRSKAETEAKVKVETKQLAEYLRKRRIETGRVVSDKMQKTVVVSVERSKRHPIYKKVMRRSVKFMAHDELGAAMGDTVRIIESRPMSKHKRWTVIEILKRTEQL
jgi:small subunit ribosomal protein S17